MGFLELVMLFANVIWTIFILGLVMLIITIALILTDRLYKDE